VKRAWLELFDWEFVIAANAALCQPKKALHKPTSDGYDRTRNLWEKNHRAKRPGRPRAARYSDQPGR
jgi:hypothetical protein